MKYFNGTPAPDVLRRLVDAWNNCELDRAEEKMLRKVLSESGYNSPETDECRLAMGLETLLSRRIQQKPRRSVAVWIRAASAALLLACGAWAVISYSAPREKIIVYIGGEKVSDSRQAAMKAYRDMEEARMEARRIREEAQREIEQQRDIIEKAYK